jgi:hypothetical protein
LFSIMSLYFFNLACKIFNKTAALPLFVLAIPFYSML